MNRRQFIRRSGIASTTVLAGLAGCTNDNSSTPPPRKSQVFEDITIDSGTLTVNLEDRPTVQSRANINSGGNNQDSLQAPTDVLGALSPVGTVAAAKGSSGRGRAGGARSAVSNGATGRNGRAKYHGGTGNTYVYWWNSHEDEVNRYQATVKKIGVSRVAPPGAKEKKLPGVGRPENGWAKTFPNPSQSVSYQLQKPGWYRVGGKLAAANGNHYFGWEAVDLLLKKQGGKLVKKQSWKVSPRL